jgi:hypothetical protein
MDDQWITNAPALAYVRELDTWIIVNNKSEMISWTDDRREVDWLSMWVLEYGAKKKAKPFVSHAKPKMIKPKLTGIGSRMSANPALYLP